MVGVNGRFGTPGGSAERPALFFASPDEFERWLEANHQAATELWMGLYKRHVSDRGLTWEQAVPVALCFGWIDSVAQRIDDDARRQRWTPRKPTSNWSAVNIELANGLIAEGRMRPAGLAAFERRRPDRERVYSYERDGEIAFPPEFEAGLRADSAAAAWFDAMPASYRRLVVDWVLSAKRAETRQSRMDQLVADSARGLLIKSQRYGQEPAWVARNRRKLGLEATGEV